MNYLLITKGIKLTAETESIIDLAIRYWRLKISLEQRSLNLDKEIERHLDRMERHFKKAYNLEILDYTGRTYNNQNVIIQSILSDPAISRKVITKSLTPEIRINGRIIKKSQVEVSEPDEKQNSVKIESRFETPINLDNDKSEEINENILQEIKEDKKNINEEAKNSQESMKEMTNISKRKEKKANIKYYLDKIGALDNREGGSRKDE